jgi:transcription-repair coupling factor (superfamily II helicase)
MAELNKLPHLAPILERLRPAVADTAQALRAGHKPAALGLRRSARLPAAAALHAELGQPMLLLTDRTDKALTLLDELGLWNPGLHRLFFPEPAPLFYENAAWGENTRRSRLNALTSLAAYHVPGSPLPAAPPLIVAPVRAVMTRTMPRRDFLKATRTLRLGERVLLDDLLRNWVSLGYEPVNTVLAAGQFARRGGILDVWPATEPQPVRLEFFGDEIETLRRFDPATQRTIKAGGEANSRLLITPAREFLLPGGDRPLPRLPSTDGAEDAPETYNEFYLPLLHPSHSSLLDYLPPQAVVVISSLQDLRDAVTEIEEQALSLRREFVQEGTLSPEFPVPYLSWSELNDSLASHRWLELGPLSHVDGDTLPEAVPLAGQFEAGPRFGGRLKTLIDYLVQNLEAGDEAVLVSRQAARLTELWTEQGLPASGGRSPSFVEGSLGEGWVFHPLDQPQARLHLLTDGEIFGWRRPEPRQRPHPVAEAPEAAYTDLQPGDWVVHVDHGIGQFLGLVRRTVEGVEREYLAVEYAGEAQLFVPVHQVDRLTRYVGPEGREPTASRLGGTEWKTVKSHVKEAVRAVAEDLLELYAKRSIVPGYTFSPDAPWQQELEASFPYVETEDQIRVLEEVKQDMESPRPMDRLICGDVGYGKTEVALRAAFKAVMDGKQVAILVPTTVLAQQHYNTFLQRLSAFPIEVEMLSRFRSQQQQKDIIRRLGEGAIDIIIGTHRLLSSDVQFVDLGLLIIDEEQRFGVTHKETLKRLRTEVDILTLTATPIPRTLYMALSGVRDISTINTPPEERLPIITHVGPYSKRLVRQAILREMERGGQVFFVHNRVQTIEAMRSHLEKLVPEARIVVAHGQMAENELSARMEKFTNGDVDVLLSTSIIESGLDIPSANTLIVDRADTFGLAQLYQLRGRVGRGAQRAYAYFFRHNRKAPTLEARQRLETIAENTQLGAGFSIAMRDLEIRGTGDILGTRQHGNIAAVGFHLYTRLLAEAVRRQRGERGLPVSSVLDTLPTQLPIVNVELPLPASIPTSYVPDKNVRLGLYRRMANLRSRAEIHALQEEFADRFGPPPESVLNLLFQLEVKLLAEQAQVASIGAEGGQLVIRFPEGEIPDWLPELGPEARVGKVALWVPYTSLPEWRSYLLELLRKLAAHIPLSQPALTQTESDR